MTKTPLLRSLFALPLCVILLGLTACTNESDSPLDYADDAMVSGADLGAEDLSGVELLGNIAVITTTHYSGGRLAAVDLTTGRTIWSADDGDPILGGDSAVVDLRSPHEPVDPVIRDLGKGEFEVYVPYRSADEITGDDSRNQVDVGVAALSGKDGRAAWLSERLVSSDKETAGLMARPVIAGGDTIVAASGHKSDADSLMTFAIDADSGDTRWTLAHNWPIAMTADTVVVSPAGKADLMLSAQGPERADNSVPEGLSLRDGQPVWDLGDEFDNVSSWTGLGDTAVVSGESGKASSSSSSKYRTVLVETDTGKVGEELEGLLSCKASFATIACDSGKKLTTIGPGDEDPVVSTPYGSGSGSSEWQILDVFDDTIIVKDETDDHDRVQALDVEGKVRAETVPGTPTAMSEDYLVSCAEAGKRCGVHPADGATKIDPTPSSSAAPIGFSDPLPSSAVVGAGPDGSEFSNVTGAALVDDALVVAGDSDSGEGAKLSAVEAESGKTTWTIDSSSTLSTESGQSVTPILRAFGSPQVLDTDDGYLVLMGATSGGGSGIAALNGRTGDLESFHRLGDGDARVDAQAANGTQASIDIDDDGHHDTALVDFTDPKKPSTTWTSRGREPLQLGDDSAVVRQAEGRGADKTAEDVELIGLGDVDDVIWNSQDVRDDEDPGTVMLESGMLIVNWNDGTEVYDATSGKSLGAIGKRLQQCRSEADAVLCDSTPNTVGQRFSSPIVLERTDSAVEFAELRNRLINGVSGSYDGRFFVDDVGGPVGMDSGGTVIDSGLSGRFAHATDDGFALFMTCIPAQCTTRSSWDVRRIE